MLSAVILAAGAGKRLNAPAPKPLVKIGAKPVIIYSLELFITLFVIITVIIIIAIIVIIIFVFIVISCSFI